MLPGLCSVQYPRLLFEQPVETVKIKHEVIVLVKETFGIFI